MRRILEAASPADQRDAAGQWALRRGRAFPRVIAGLALVLATRGAAGQAAAGAGPASSPPHAAAAGPVSSPPHAAAASSPDAPSSPAKEAIAPEAVPAAAQSVAAEISRARSALDSETTDRRIAAALPAATDDVDARFTETARLTAGSPALADLRDQGGAWEETAGRFADWQRELTDESDRLQKQTARFDQLSAQWGATLAAARASATPADVVARIEQTAADIQHARDAVEARHAAALSLLEKIASQAGRVAQAREAVDDATQRVVDRLFVRQAPPVWDLHQAAVSGAQEAGEGERSLGAQGAALAEYLERNSDRGGIYLAVLAALAVLLHAVRRRIRTWAERVPALAPTQEAFDFPVASALVLSLVASRWIYAGAPYLLRSIIGGLALFATVIILRRIGHRSIVPALYALLALYVVEQVRGLYPSADPLSRLLFLAEMAAGAIFAYAWARRLAAGPGSRQGAAVARTLSVLLAAALVAHAVGLISLGELTGGGVLTAADAAVFFYAVALISDALLLLALHARPLVYSRLVQRHADSLWRRGQRVILWAALAGWALAVLDRLTLRERLFAAAKAVLAIGVKAGSLDISIGDLLAFGLTLWVAVLASRLVNFILEEDVFPRSSLPRGLPYAITTTVHYLILVIGFVAAVAVLGVDMTKLTILVGALTVGIGFGLQNIINNFVSGLILLFERPVKVGDVIQIGDAMGIVQRIGIRATIVTTTAGAQIIVPNGQFISSNVTNLTGSGAFRPVQIAIAVVPGSDVRRVLEVLMQTAAGCRGVLQSPAPQALVVKLGPDMLLFDLRVWTGHDEDWVRVINDVTLAAGEGLRQANIAIR